METIATTALPGPLPGPLPGRLGDSDMCLGTDPRADARLIQGMTPFGMQQNAPVSEITPSSPLEDRLAMIAATEAALQDFFPTLYAGLPEVQGVERSVETIDGVDGNAITLYIHRPAAATGDVPAILHLHGGGMALLAAADDQFVRWRDGFASRGVVVVGVEFRNSAGVPQAARRRRELDVPRHRRHLARRRRDLQGGDPGCLRGSARDLVGFAYSLAD